MSAHKLFCYAPQRGAVVEWMRDVGAVVSSTNPHAITTRYDIAGIDKRIAATERRYAAGCITFTCSET